MPVNGPDVQKKKIDLDRMKTRRLKVLLTARAARRRVVRNGWAANLGELDRRSLRTILDREFQNKTFAWVDDNPGPLGVWSHIVDTVVSKEEKFHRIQYVMTRA